MRHDLLSPVAKAIQEANIFFHKNDGITVCQVRNASAGMHLASDILTVTVDKTTILLLSGGKTPKELYQDIAKEGKLHPGAVGLVDERFGEPMHENSNEKMLKETGFLGYLKAAKIPYYPILYRHPDPPAGGEGSEKILHSVQNDKKREETARRYEEQLRLLFTTYKRHIAVLGIGLDGHTAGLPASARLWQAGLPDRNSRSKADQPLDEKIYTTTNLITEYNDISGVYGERVTMTFTALSMMDFLLVLVFGKEKKRALGLMFLDGSEKEVPSRFFERPEIAQKTILITDQTV